jgi:hypothetical protein
MYADYVVCVTLYTRRDSCSLLYARVSCCFLYPHCTAFASNVFLVAFFRFPRYTSEANPVQRGYKKQQPTLAYNNEQESLLVYNVTQTT